MHDAKQALGSLQGRQNSSGIGAKIIADFEGVRAVLDKHRETPDLTSRPSWAYFHHKSSTI
jgi:hypothetical protein